MTQIIELIDIICFTLVVVLNCYLLNKLTNSVDKAIDDIDFMESELGDLRDRVIMLEYKVNVKDKEDKQ